MKVINWGALPWGSYYYIGHGYPANVNTLSKLPTWTVQITERFKDETFNVNKKTQCENCQLPVNVS